jgi:hypothetical protein
MLPAYAVVVGKYLSYTREQGRWLHVTFKMQAGADVFEAAVDVNEPNGKFQYQIVKKLDSSLFTTIAGLADGGHHLDSNATSGAMDYARSKILRKAMKSWSNVTGNEAGNALVSILTGSTKIFAFGAPYTTGLGVHDVHCNQGDPPGPFRALDGIWQDGCVVALMKDGTLSAYLGKFATQTLNTDDHGIPK